MTTPVPVTAYATASACGAGNLNLLQMLQAQQSALGDLSLFELHFSAPVGEIKSPLPAIKAQLEIFNTRNARVALLALEQAQDGLRAAVSAARDKYGEHRVGVVVGTSTSGLYETESAYKSLLLDGCMPDDFHFLHRHAYQATPRFLQQELQLSGPCYAISTACSSGVKAIAAGQRLINSGICDAVLVGGVDTLCRLTLRGFHSLELVSPHLCQPMDKQRRGINIGEAAALLLLERPAHENRNSPHVLSVGESSDAHHMSAPHPQGLGAKLSMQKALDAAGLSTGDIDYLNLHATATRVNDQVEAQAVYDIFSDKLLCSATKGLTGHTLGAAGALESVITLLALENQFLPGSVGLQAVDPECRCQVLKQPQLRHSLSIAMSNSFGFGGNNASVIFSKGQ